MKVEKGTKKIENDERKKKYMSDIDNKEEKKGNKVVKGILIALIIIILLMISWTVDWTQERPGIIMMKFYGR